MEKPVPPSSGDTAAAIGGAVVGGDDATASSGPVVTGVVDAGGGAATVNTIRSVNGCPSGPTRRQRTVTSPGASVGSGATSTWSPAAPWTSPLTSVRAPDASMTCTVAVSNGTGCAKTIEICVGAATTAPSAGSLDSNVLCAATRPGAAATAATTTRSRPTYGPRRRRSERMMGRWSCSGVAMSNYSV